MPGLHFVTGAGLACCSADGSRRWERSRSTPCWAASTCAGASGRRCGKRAPRIVDVFDPLTYRERYEDLLARTGRDALTGALDRGRLEAQGEA